VVIKIKEARVYFKKVGLFFLILLTLGCSTTKPKVPEKDITAHDRTFYTQRTHTIVDILYGTDRHLDLNQSLENRYSGKRSKLKFGVAQVSIPKNHTFGQIERPGVLDGDERIGRDVVITKLDPLASNIFSKILKNKLGKTRQEDILVFIHGYNVSFASAVRRTAQLAYDLEFQGVPLTYSWSSQGNLSDYMKDEVSVQYTIPKLVKFLQEIIKNKGDANIHILAHSMGTRALTNALKDISFMYDTAQFKNIILAAPDIDVDVFESNLYPYILKTTEKITLYASSEDSALEVSNKLHGGHRLGEGGKRISVFEEMVTIDATGVDTSMLGHSYFAEKEVLVDDLRLVVNKSLPPTQRSNLVKKVKEKLFFWHFKNK
jgi:esterase/lipase superfamily enzyme